MAMSNGYTEISSAQDIAEWSYQIADAMIEARKKGAAVSEWITDRLPTEEDATSYGFVWTTFDGIVISRDHMRIEIGEPWQPIQVPAPYSEPKRWKLRWNGGACHWNIVNSYDGLIVAASLQLDYDAVCTAQRICDIYNEAMP
jgi:hypothetical protein